MPPRLGIYQNTNVGASFFAPWEAKNCSLGVKNNAAANLVSGIS